MEHDLLILIDATMSMGQYLNSLNTSIPQIISVSALTNCFSRIGLLAYRDYDHFQLLEWSGWSEQSTSEEADYTDLLALAKSLKQYGGRDTPEAVKTGLAKAYEVMRPEAKTTILLYADAPPHPALRDRTPRADRYSFDINGPLEKKALSNVNLYQGFGPKFVDWVSACNLLREGDKQAQVFSLLPQSSREVCGYYNYLSTMTGGACIILRDPKPATISQVTIDLLLSWMGVQTSTNVSDKDNQEAALAYLSRYINVDYIEAPTDEFDPRAEIFFSPICGDSAYSSIYYDASAESVFNNVTLVTLTSDALKKYIPKKDVPVANFAKAWSTDPAYRVLAIKHLKQIIDFDVRAILVNPVFGTLWRTVCSDKTCASRSEILEAFSAKVGEVNDAEDKEILKAWLENSYDYTAEVLERINGVPDKERFPCVYLDPTLDFRSTEEDAGFAGLNRADLLEISRSCDPSILGRLGRVLTKLTYVESEADLPEHIAKATPEEVPQIPMALASEEHKRQFWRILLHLIVPGTMLSSRPAALLAALSLHLGIVPLTQVADREALSFRNKWKDINTPETWSVPCLDLLLKADKAYTERQARVKAASQEAGDSKKPATLLKPDDRELFERLVAFRMLEVNLNSELIARVGWTPQKAVGPMGPVIICQGCKYPRSVSVMGRNGKCGLCTYVSQNEGSRDIIDVNVSTDDGPETSATWVECCTETCRAQYVIYDAEGLRVRAKCYYCRAKGGLTPEESANLPNAPYLECQRCLNRFIWPVEYRPSSLVASEFQCVFCTAGRQTVVEVETTAAKMTTENSHSWIAVDSLKPDISPFTGRSLYQAVSRIGLDDFMSRITLFPFAEHTQTQKLLMKGKDIFNAAEIIATLQDLVSRRTTIKKNCSLCYGEFRPEALNPACGRRGCFQNVCRDCLVSWYGLNKAGRIINVSALSCPFCRRRPTAHTMANYAVGAHLVANMAKAVEEQGTWVYAWCVDCSVAKQFMERVCARGPPPEVSDWICGECVEQEEQLELARIAALEAAGMDELADSMRKTVIAKQVGKMKECPGCGVMTHRIDGCAHMTCPVRDCGADWCYFCGVKFDASRIYEHLEDIHGGIYDPDDEIYDEEEIVN